MAVAMHSAGNYKTDWNGGTLHIAQASICQRSSYIRLCNVVFYGVASPVINVATKQVTDTMLERW